MLILPVLDLLRGQIVHGIAGRREEYRPIRSRLSEATDPLSVARGFRDQLGLSTLYLADLDAIAGRPPALLVVESLLKDGFQLWLDSGLHDLDLASTLQQTGVDTIIAALETLPDIEFVGGLCGCVDPGRVVVSLDMKGGRPLTRIAGWESRAPVEIAEEIIGKGCNRLLLLDLDQVGMNQGPATEELCRRLRARHGAKLSLATGGGVRGREDLLRLKNLGVAAVLVASALHDGRITREDLGLCQS